MYNLQNTSQVDIILTPGTHNLFSVITQTLRCNVDMLKLIQLGLSFTDAKGNWAEGCACWQFNFKFSLS